MPTNMPRNLSEPSADDAADSAEYVCIKQRLRRDALEKLQTISVAEERSVQQTIRKAINDYIANYEKENKQ